MKVSNRWRTYFSSNCTSSSSSALRLYYSGGSFRFEDFRYDRTFRGPVDGASCIAVDSVQWQADPSIQIKTLTRRT